MKQRTKSHTSWMTAITFAEAGEWETAREYMPVGKRTLLDWLEKHFLAAAFAEEGLHEEAVESLSRPSMPLPSTGFGDFIETLGLSGVRIRYGSLSQLEAGLVSVK